MHVHKSTNSKLVHIFQLQKLITKYLVYICCNFVYRCLLFQVDNLNLATNLENDCSCAMLITCKCTPFCEKLDCDTKSEPPYHVITLMPFFWSLLTTFMGRTIICWGFFSLTQSPFIYLDMVFPHVYNTIHLVGLNILIAMILDNLKCYS